MNRDTNRHLSREVEDALREVMSDTTTLVIAHRPSTVMLADRVALLEAQVLLSLRVQLAVHLPDTQPAAFPQPVRVLQQHDECDQDHQQIVQE